MAEESDAAGAVCLLLQLPADVLGVISAHLDQRDTAALLSTCRALVSLGASCPEVWGKEPLRIVLPTSEGEAGVAAFLVRRRAALRSLNLQVANTGGPLAVALTDAIRLESLDWRGVDLDLCRLPLESLARLRRLTLHVCLAHASFAGARREELLAGLPLEAKPTQAAAGEASEGQQTGLPPPPRPRFPPLALPPTMEAFSLSSERFGPELGPILCAATHLRELCLENRCAKAPALRLEPVLRRLRGITSLTLHWDLKWLPRRICNLSALRELDLSGNPLAKLSARLPPGLTRLALRSCRLSEAPAAALLRPLSATLEDLDLSGNDFGPRMEAPGHEKTALAPLGCLTRLTCLALADCRLLALPAELTALGPSLRALDCSDNHDLGGVNNLLRRDNPPLAPLWALTRLRELSMAYCYLWRLPPELVAAAGTLERLNLTGCSDLGDRGTDVGIQLGPAGLGTLVALRHLTLRYCDLRAEVAPSLLQLPDLKVLDVAGKNFRDGWPAALGPERLPPGLVVIRR